VTEPMESVLFPIAILSGAGGEAPVPRAFGATDAELRRLEPVLYPGWKRYVDEDFSADWLIDDLAAAIARRAAGGKVGVVGISLGGHLGYAVALRLQEMGVDIAGFCAIDSFMVSSDAAKPGWRGRFVGRVVALLRSRSFGELAVFLRLMSWRGLIRLFGASAPALLRQLRDYRGLSVALAFDPILEKEVTLRLLLREIAPWLARLDRQPTALSVPATHLRSRHTEGDDLSWRRRCPNMKFVEIAGDHETLFESETVDAFRAAFLQATRGWN